LDATETRHAVESGRRVLKLAGIEPQGFVAPSYAYTSALREVVSARFRWWAELLHLGWASVSGASVSATRAPAAPARESGSASGRELLFPPIALSTAGPVRRAFAPAMVRAGAMIAGPVLRLDLQPSYLDHTRHMLALEWVLNHSRGRVAVTYDELAGMGSAGHRRQGPSMPPEPRAAA
jgi:hypothetical protein